MTYARLQPGEGWDACMLLDYNSLLLAIGFSAACLSLTLFGTWMAARSDRFLLTWAVSVLVGWSRSLRTTPISQGPEWRSAC